MRPAHVLLTVLFMPLLAMAGASTAFAASQATATLETSSLAATYSAKRIALTFDDGYNSTNVNRVLDILESNHVPATVFPVESWALRDPATFSRIAARFEVGDHTFSHPFLTRLSDAAVRREILGGVRSHLFRPPYGDINARVRAIAQSLGYRVVMWDIDSRDWTGIPAAREVANVVGHASDGKIVLMHMGDLDTVEALPEIIRELRAQGYTFVTVSELWGKQGAVGPARPNAAAGQSLVVGNTYGIGVYIRSTVARNAEVRAWPDGTELKPTGQTASGGGWNWIEVTDPSGYVGWVPSQYTIQAR